MDLLRSLLDTKGSRVKSSDRNLAVIPPSTVLSHEMAVMSPKPGVLGASGVVAGELNVICFKDFQAGLLHYVILKLFILNV